MRFPGCLCCVHVVLVVAVMLSWVVNILLYFETPSVLAWVLLWLLWSPAMPLSCSELKMAIVYQRPWAPVLRYHLVPIPQLESGWGEPKGQARTSAQHITTVTYPEPGSSRSLSSAPTLNSTYPRPLDEGPIIHHGKVISTAKRTPVVRVLQPIKWGPSSKPQHSA